MSDLQLGLLAIGVAVLAAVIAYNKWQEVKFRRRGEEAFGSRHRDVLLSDDAMARRPEAPVTGDGEFVEHVLGDVTTHTPAAPGMPAILDPAADFIVDIESPAPVRGTQVAAAIAAQLSPGSYPIRWEGRVPATGVWEAGTDAGRYKSIRLGLQLVARVGPVGDLDLANFCAGAQEVAAQLGGVARFDDFDAGRARAEALDQFCADVDIQLRFNLVGRGGGFTAAQVRDLAQANGCVPEADGRLHCRDASGVEIFALADRDGVGLFDRVAGDAVLPQVSLLLDVPRAPAGAATFRRFIEFARVMERSLGALLVDDNQQPLTDAGFARIGLELEGIYRRMAAQGLAAGSPLAQRIFA